MRLTITYTVCQLSKIMLMLHGEPSEQLDFMLKLSQVWRLCSVAVDPSKKINTAVILQPVLKTVGPLTSTDRIRFQRKK